MVVERVEAARDAGPYQAEVVGMRESVAVQPTVVERANPILTTQEFPAGTRGVASPGIEMEYVPNSMAAAGIETTGDTRANMVYIGQDRNRGGIPDSNQPGHRPAPFGAG